MIMKIAKLKDGLNSLSIKWKIFFYLTLFCGFLLSLLWLFQIVFLDSFYENIKTREIKESAIYISQNIDADDLEELVYAISSESELSIEIMSKNGSPMYSSRVIKESIIDKMAISDKLQLYQDTKSSGGELLNSYTIMGPNDGNRRPPETIVYSKIVNDKFGNELIVFANATISPVSATVDTLMAQLYYITGFMIGFSILLAFFLAKKISRPIESINEAAKTLALGNYNADFEVQGYREINELSSTLSYAATELSKVDSLRSELIANISHDLRTPLTLIGGYAEAMRDLPGENTPENAQIIIDETKRLGTLVNDVLDTSKYRSGQQALNFTQFNLTKKLKEVIDRLNELLKSEGYSIDFKFDEKVDVRADETRISQAFYNLLINAINYTGDDKKVLVTQTRFKDSVRVSISDSGEGISAENLPHIWDRYYKIDKTHKRPVTGTGLGLSIVKSIIDSHGGEYGVESEVGGGSTFWFSLGTGQKREP